VWSQFHDLNNYLRDVVLRHNQQHTITSTAETKLESIVDGVNVQQPTIARGTDDDPEATPRTATTATSPSNASIVPPQRTFRHSHLHDLRYDTEKIAQLILRYDQYCADIYASLPKNALMVVTTGHGDIHKFRVFLFFRDALVLADVLFLCLVASCSGLSQRQAASIAK